MKLSYRQSARRSGFTLVELLVVIAIIAVLVSLTAGAVLRTLTMGPKAVTANDVSQLAQAVEAFKVQFKVKYMPSRIILYDDLTKYGNSQLEIDSLQFINTVWPRINPQVQGWLPGQKTAGVILEGDQCIVFFLGGPQANSGSPGFLGWSTNPRDPTQQTGDRIAKLYEFNSTRLVTSWTPVPGGNKFTHGNGFYSYLDGYGKTPYAYFSSYKADNGYNRYDAKYNLATPGSGTTDCPTLGVSPYIKSLLVAPNGTITTIIYQNSDTYQILSAGLDCQFGPGNMIWPFSGTPPATAKDDLTNFAGSILGAGQ